MTEDPYRPEDVEGMTVRGVAEAMYERVAHGGGAWPYLCTATSLMLVPVLRLVQPEVHWALHAGTCGLEGPPGHAWCEDAYGAIVDITYDQIELRYGPLVISALEAPGYPHWTQRRYTTEEEHAIKRSATVTLGVGAAFIGTSLKDRFRELDPRRGVDRWSRPHADRSTTTEETP